MTKAILINAQSRSISPIEFSPSVELKQLQKLVEGWIEAVYLRNGDTMYVNEEGMIKEIPYGFELVNHPYLIHGNAVILGKEDGEGYDTDVKSTVEEIKAVVSFWGTSV